MTTQPDWWGPHADAFLPRHVPHGLPVTSLPLGDSLEERPPAPEVGRFDQAMPVPPNAHCVFAAASYGFPEQRLLATPTVQTCIPCQERIEQEDGTGRGPTM